jgi:hypothetical protein
MNNNLPSEMKAKRFVRVRGFFVLFYLTSDITRTSTL